MPALSADRGLRPPQSDVKINKNHPITTTKNHLTKTASISLSKRGGGAVFHFFLPFLLSLFSSQFYPSKL
jgi:hypothetical protein